jgi:hypothetical protein
LSFAAQSVGASTRLVPDPGSPDPAKAVVSSADVGGAVVKHQGYYKDTTFPSTISYSREFSRGKVFGTHFGYLASDAEVGNDAAIADGFVRGLRRYFESPEGRAQLKKQIEQSGGKPVRGVTVRVASPRPLGIGKGFYIAVKRLALGVPVEQTDLAVFSVDRLLGTVALIGAPATSIPRATLTRISATMVGRFGTELEPKSLAVPTVSGTPQSGRTLTAGIENWGNGPAAFTYQWQRCDRGGANCAPIDGAVRPEYVLVGSDVGAMLKVTVSASNGYGTSTATSAAVGPVVAAG